MAKNKMSFWAVFILVVTLVSAAIFTLGVVAFTTALGPAEQAARDEAIKQGLSGNDLEIAVSLAIGIIVSGFVVSSILDVLTIVGGFLFSLKGRWGVFCIVMAIISGAGNIFELTNAISKQGGAFSIVTSSIMVVLSVLMVIACFKHRAENRA